MWSRNFSDKAENQQNFIAHEKKEIEFKYSKGNNEDFIINFVER